MVVVSAFTGPVMRHETPSLSQSPFRRESDPLHLLPNRKRTREPRHTPRRRPVVLASATGVLHRGSPPWFFASPVPHL